MNYKLIALDMDGTVLNERGEISAENAAAISRAMAAGVTVIFSTGRGIQSIRPFARELELRTPVVAVNGGEVWKSPDELMVRHAMDPAMIVRMHRMAVDAETWYWAYATDGMYNRENWPEDILDKEWLKFGFQSGNRHTLARISTEIAAWDELEVTNSNWDNLEVNPKGVSKASGVAEVCRLLGIGLGQVIAMGDSLNDIAIIRAAGLGIAMGNAQNDVKEAADAVTAHHSEHGVAAAIRKYVFGEAEH